MGDATTTPMTVRPLRWDGDGVHAADLDAVAGLYAAYETDRLGGVDTAPADISEYILHRPHVDRGRTVLLLEGDEPVATVYVSLDPFGKDVYGDIAVLPGRQSAVTESVRWLVESGRAIAAEQPDAGWTLRISHWLPDDAMSAALAEHGLEPVRRFYRMRIESDSPEIPELMPQLPDGVEIVVRDDEETRRRIWALDMASFSDHYNFTPTPYDDWWSHFQGGTRDPEGWWLLTVDGEDAAFCLLAEARAELGEGYVSVLGVKEEFRGRGLGSLLLRRAFVRYRDMGRTATLLGVDAENTTGAVGVYEAVGMRAAHTMQGWALGLS